MTRVHFVYSFGSSISCPEAIGRNVAERLRTRYEVLEYHWAGFQKIEPGPDDVLLGHACPVPLTTFRRSCRAKGWKRVLLMSPHCHGDDHQPAFNSHVMPYCDLYLAITGNYWFDRVGQSGFAHWRPKMRHIDLAVDKKDFPPVKRGFNPPGARKFVYIGRDAWYKNVEYLSEIAQAAGMEIGWIGSGEDYAGLKKLGQMNFTSAEAKQTISEYDFLLTVGKADGNPTTILEAMAWGLIPVCTPQSGYEKYRSILNIPLGDVAGGVKLLRELQNMPERTLCELQQTNWRLVDEHFNWDRIAQEVIDAIEDTSSPKLGEVTLKRRLEILWAEVNSPYWRDYLSLKKLPHRLFRSSFRAPQDSAVSSERQMAPQAMEK